MSTFQDLYAHAAENRERAMQFAVIKDIRRRAVREMMDDGVYIEPENPDEMTEEEHAARQAESAYAYGLRSIIDVRVLEEENGNPAYATVVRNSATKPFCIALCLQTKLEELLVNDAIPAGKDPVFHVIVTNDDPAEVIQPLADALEVLRPAYPQWRFTVESRADEAAARAEIARDLRSAMVAVKNDPKPENTQKLMVLLSACRLVFPAQAPAGLSQAADGSGVHLQFGKVRSKDNQTYFMAFSDLKKMTEWKRMSYVELGITEYAPLILSSKDDGLIIDPNVGESLVLTKQHIETLQQQTEMFNNMMENLADFMPPEKDMDEVQKDINELLSMYPDEEPKKKNRFGKKKK